VEPPASSRWWVLLVSVIFCLAAVALGGRGGHAVAATGEARFSGTPTQAGEHFYGALFGALSGVAFVLAVFAYVAQTPTMSQQNSNYNNNWFSWWRRRRGGDLGQQGDLAALEEEEEARTRIRRRSIALHRVKNNDEFEGLGIGVQDIVLMDRVVMR
jgi:hypothetical protein